MIMAKSSWRWIGLCFLAGVAITLTAGRADDGAFKEGLCPQRDAAQDFDEQKLVGVWYDLYTNYEHFTVPSSQRTCWENKFTLLENKTLTFDSVFLDANGTRSTLQKQFVPIANQPGKYISHRLVDDAWTPHWTYAFVALNDDALMEFACKQFGDKHKVFYRIKGRKMSLPEGEVNILKQIATDSGDNRSFGEYNHNNCTYEFQ